MRVLIAAVPLEGDGRMKFRAIVEVTDSGAAQNVGGPVIVGYHTFEFSQDKMAELIKSVLENRWSEFNIKGCEVIEEADDE